MQRQRLKFLTSVGVTPEPLRVAQQQQELRRKREQLRSLLAQDFIDLAALRAAVIDGALHVGPEQEDSRGEGENEKKESDVGGERERPRERERDTADISALRSITWKLLLNVLPPHRKSW